jgi:hypothetical protein
MRAPGARRITQELSMPFGISFSGSKSKTKTQSQEHNESQSQGWSQQQSQDWGLSRSQSANFNNAQSNSTRTSLVPEWGSSLVQGVAGRVAGLNGLDPNSLVAPAHSLQTQAAARAGDLVGGSWNFDAAADVARGVTNTSWLDARMAAPTAQINERVLVDPAQTVRGESLLDNLSAYMSPYTRDVVDSTLRDFDVDAERTRAQQDLDLAGAGAFGGSGAALTKSMTEGELARARASAASVLRDQAFQRGTALSSEDAARRQQAQALNAQLGLQRSSQNAQMAQERAVQNAQLTQQDWNQRTSALLAAQDQRLRGADALANVSTLYDQNMRANIETQAGMGAALRDIDQQQRQAPMTSAQQVVAMLSGLPIGLFTGEQTSSNQSSEQFSDSLDAKFGGSQTSGTTAESRVSDSQASGTSKTKGVSVGGNITGTFS